MYKGAITMNHPLPRGWQKVRLGDICDINVNSLKENTNKNYQFKYIDLSSVKNGIIDFPNNYITFKNAPSRAKRIIKIDDVIMATVRPNLKGFAYISFDPKEYICSTGFAVLTSKSEICMKYIYQILYANYIEKQISNMLVGSNYPALNTSDILNIKILLPPIDEQKRIADILSTFDDLIENLNKLIEKKEIYKKGVMQRVLTGEVRFNGFTDEWETMPLCKILEERKTFQPKDGNLEHVSLTKEGVVPKSERYERDFLVKDKNKQYKITKINDICYNPANLKFGVICKNNYGEGIFSPIYVTFEVNKGFNIDFISYILKSESFINNARRYEEGTVYERKAVSPENLLSIKIKIPSLEEQNKIAELLTIIDKDIDNLKQILQLRKLQKKGVMQKLLTGEVRI